MAYRRNKSNKVPNVKLRPAIPAPSGSSSNSRNGSKQMKRNDSGFDSEGEGDVSAAYSVDICPRPFKGVLLCATGINDKQAIELGAQSLSDLTDRVTHVIAEVPGSAKYTCALMNGTPIMHPSWITESYKVWLRGDDVDLRDSVARHRLPIFNDVVITVSGISSVERRMEINKLVSKNGGTYVKNLERPVKVTHLVCSREDDGTVDKENMNEPWTSEKTDKMIYAQKFNERREANIHIVWEEWLWDCITYGGRFDEEEYSITKPRPQRKTGPIPMVVGAADTTIPVDHPIEPSSSNPQPDPVSPGAQRPTFHTSEEEEELASVKRVPNVKLRIWETIMGSRGFEVSGGKLIRSPSKSQAARQSVPPAFPPADLNIGGSTSFTAKLAQEENGRPAAAGGSLLASFRRTKSFAPATKDTSTQKAKQPFQLVATLAAVSSEDAFWGVPGGEIGPILAQGGEDIPVASGSHIPSEYAREAIARESSFMVAGPSRQQVDESVAKAGIFNGMTFHALGEARCASVRTAVEDSGGKLVDDRDAEVDYIIVRLVSGSKLYREEPDESLRGKYRTECWLERCMYEERICEPSEHIAFVPLGIQTPIAGAEEISLSCSGLDQSEGFWIRRLARALGITLAVTFSRRTTHLLCPSMTGAKFEKAREWNIAVVDMTWLEQLARIGHVPSISVHDTPSPGLLDASEFASAQNVVDYKGKSREIADVTKAGLNERNSPGFEAPPPQDLRRSESRMRSREHADTMFGPPGELLSHSPPSSPPMPPGDPATSPPRSRAPTAEPRSTPVHDDQTHDTGLDRQPTLQKLKEDMMQTRIPSSKSPSPIKPPFGEQLQRSKRQPSDEDFQMGRGKRARPLLRSKSKQDQQLLLGPLPPPLAPNQFDPYAIVGEEDISMLAAGKSDSEEQNIRVTYEDPHQRDERERLMRLLESQKKEIWEVDDDEPTPPPAQPTANSKPAQKSSSVKKGRNAPSKRGSRVSGF
ncbi:hypothetical protein EUX98_g5958 [Antrodiella citrinella]|uniref:BRCT domain-containing protein n=1 Tax=Antrodiella citrinella TaxID=2447956 RepID=A0A4S4MQ68_9APHY|nr:hypothetical protein EUX98_g5958 [Antrodiella citrinella]